MKAEGFHLQYVDRAQALIGGRIEALVEGVVGREGAALEEVGGIRGLSIVPKVGDAAVQGKIGGRRGCPAREQMDAGRREPVQVEKIGT